MKKQFLALFASLMLVAVVSFGQDNKEKLWINENSHDFGKIPQGKPVYTTFELKGVGDSLKLEMVQAGCGCTTPEFKTGTYAPGAPVKIKVGFNAAAVGPFNKPITITYNGGMQKVIMITGTVDATPAAPAPGNGAVNKIKQ
ncbi:MAG: DUF1573 domain-containing protein [Chitinophagaceae bacterium]|jgi:hypothetical protein|nr:DUF1573 domain-containing protein [Chitinophagaceae bacterium]